MAAISWRQLSSVISEVAQGIGSLRKTKWTFEGTVVWGIIGVIGVFAIIRALAPPVGDDWDSLAYHLAIPKLYLQHHGIYFIPFSSHSNFPFNWEMLYTLGLSFGSISLAKLFHFLSGALLLASVCSAAKRHFGAETARLSALILAGVPTVAWLATTSYIDLTTALFSFLVVYSLLNFTTSKDRKWAVFAGISAGLAAGTKMTALIMIAIAAVWIIFDAKSSKPDKPVRLAIGAIIICALLAAPWYIKSLIYTGNPVYPFFYGIFGGKDWSAESAALYRADQLKFGMGRDFASLLMLPWNLTFHFARFNDFAARLPAYFIFKGEITSNETVLFPRNAMVYLTSIGPVFLAGLPLIALGTVKKGIPRALILASSVLLLAWFFMMQDHRYLIPILALIAPAIAYSAVQFGYKKITLVVAASAGVFTAILMGIFVWPSVPVSLSIEKPDVYLTRELDLYPASKFINDELPKNAKIAMFGDTRGFYIDRNYFWAEPLHNALIPFDTMNDGNDLIKWFRSHKVTHVLINQKIMPDPNSKDAPKYAKLLGEAMPDMEEVYSERNIMVYQIK